MVVVTSSGDVVAVGVVRASVVTVTSSGDVVTVGGGCGEAAAAATPALKAAKAVVGSME